MQECVRHLELSFPTISDTRIDPWCITVLRYLNRLTHLTIDIHHDPEPTRAPTENGNIRHVSVNGTTYLDPQPEFVQLVQALTTLPNTPIDHIDVHILLEERDHNGADLSRFFSVPLQPSRLTLTMPDFCDPWATRIAPRIAHVAQRLTHLHVKEIWPGWRRKQRSRADFSGLSSLVELRVPAAMWFDHAALGVSVPPGQNVSWQGFIWLEGDIYRPSILSLVPTSLQTLHVDFPAHNGAIFALGKGYIQHLEKKLTSPGQTLNMEPGYRWLSELAQAKPSQLQSLRSVTVEEGLEIVNAVGSSGRLYGRMDREAPVELRRKFGLAGVGLEMRLRGFEYKETSP